MGTALSGLGSTLLIGVGILFSFNFKKKKFPEQPVQPTEYKVTIISKNGDKLTAKENQKNIPLLIRTPKLVD